MAYGFSAQNLNQVIVLDPYHSPPFGLQEDRILNTLCPPVATVAHSTWDVATLRALLKGVPLQDLPGSLVVLALNLFVVLQSEGGISFVLMECGFEFVTLIPRSFIWFPMVFF